MDKTKVDSRRETAHLESCPQCGHAFDCCRGGDCWCAAEPYRLPMPDGAVQRCLCPACLRKRVAAALRQ